jgi:LmbE family N-acetylglucosaminyl deacetylase
MTQSLVAGRILFIGAHCDDIEIGCGGTAAKFAQAGNAVAFAIATPENEVAEQAKRRVEAANAAAVLGLTEANGRLFFGSFPDGELDQRYKEMRQWMKNILQTFRPEAVFIHRNDDHTDHQAIHQVGIGVFQKQNLFLYYIPRPSPETPFDPNYAEDISGYIEKKVQMCECHASQPADYIGRDSVTTNSHYWYLRWFARLAPRTDGHAEAFIIRGWRARLYGEPSPYSDSDVPSVRYGLQLVRDADGTLHWEER